MRKVTFHCIDECSTVERSAENNGLEFHEEDLTFALTYQHGYSEHFTAFNKVLVFNQVTYITTVFFNFHKLCILNETTFSKM